MKNMQVFNYIKKTTLLILSTSFLTSCGKNPLYEEYGTIQKFLNHGKDYSLNWVNSNLYPNKYNNAKCFDSDGVLYNLLYDIDFKEISKSEAAISISEDVYIQYGIPFDDAASIYLKSNGTGYIGVAPDLSQSLMVYIQVDQQTTDKIFEAANNLLARFVEKQ